MRSDFNTPAAIAQLQDWAKDWNSILDEWEQHDTLHQSEHNEISKARAWLETALREILGIASPDRSGGDSGSEGPIEGLLDELVALREQAREDENYEMADRIRDRLQDLGYRIEDRPKGTEWERIDDQ
jgi:cysteinyl-tRNA synthetase